MDTKFKESLWLHVVVPDSSADALLLRLFVFAFAEAQATQTWPPRKAAANSCSAALWCPSAAGGLVWESKADM